MIGRYHAAFLRKFFSMLVKVENQPEPHVKYVDYAADALFAMPKGKEPAEYLCELGGKRGNPLYSYFEHDAKRGLELYNLGLARHLIATVYRKLQLQENQKQTNRAMPEPRRVNITNLANAGFVRDPDTGKLARESEFSAKQLRRSLLHEAQTVRGSLDRLLARTQHGGLSSSDLEESMNYLDHFIEQVTV